MNQRSPGRETTGVFRSATIRAETDGELLQLEREQVAIPAGILGQLVVGDHVGADLLRSQMIEPQRWDSGHPQKLRGTQAAVACNHMVTRIDQHRVREPERLDRVRDLADLLFGVSARVAASGFERCDRALLDANVTKRGRDAGEASSRRFHAGSMRHGPTQSQRGTLGTRTPTA